MTPDDLQEFSEFVSDFVSAVRDAKEAGRSVDDIASSWEVPSNYSGYDDPTVDRLKANAQVIYDELP